MTNKPATLSEMKAQMSSKKKLKLSAATKAKQKEAAKQDKAPAKAPVKSAKKSIKVSTDVKAKAPKEKTPKVSFESHENVISKLVKVELKAGTNKSGAPIMTGSNKNLTLESNRDRKEMYLKLNGKTACEIRPNKNGYKFSMKLDRDVKVPEGAKVIPHEVANPKNSWKDIIVSDPSTMVSQFTA